MRIMVSDRDTAQAAAARLRDVGFVAYVPTQRLRKNRHFLQVVTSAHERVAGLASQRAFDIVREVDPTAWPLGSRRPPAS